MLDKRISESFDRKLREINCKSADSILESVHSLNEEELFDLPNDVEVSIYDIGYVDGETEADELEELLSDYLSDTYGFCHFGFDFDVDGDTIQVYNIKWDISESLNEMALYGLQPEHDYRSSFYNKAIVDIDNNTGDKTLYSYHTPVAKISKSGELELLPKWNSSNTTLRHVKEFLRQNGFKADSLKQITKDYLSESAKEPDVASFVEEIKLVVDPEDIDTHESDIYVKVSPKVTEILKKYNMLDNPLLSKFIDEIDHEEWYEIPFGNLGKRIKKEELTEELDENTKKEVEVELEDILKRNPEKHGFDADTEEVKYYVVKLLKDKGYKTETSGNDSYKPNKYHVEYWKEEKIEESYAGYDHYGVLAMEEFDGPAYIYYNGGPGAIEHLVRARNNKYYWNNIANGGEPYVFDSFQDALKVQEKVGGEILPYEK